MKAFLLTFDYTVAKQAKLLKLHEKIKDDPNINSWWHHLNGTYILLTSDHIKAEDIRVFFHQFFPEEHCLIVQIRATDYGGWLPEEAWNWMKRGIK